MLTKLQVLFKEGIVLTADCPFVHFLWRAYTRAYNGL